MTASEFGPKEFESASQYGVHYSRCEPCMFGQHVGGQHGWAGPEDIAHAAKTGADATGICACPCVTDPSMVTAPPEFEPDMDAVSLELNPCPECGEAGPCAWDANGRPLIHAVADEPDAEA